jgi:hypothetical protein
VQIEDDVKYWKETTIYMPRIAQNYEKIEKRHRK